MKHHGIIIGLAATLGACAAPAPAPAPAVGLANPASTYCISLGGTLQPRHNPDGGEYAMCRLPNGTLIEEWELYRRDHH